MTREAVVAVLADLNVSGWRVESAHDCGGDDAVCAQRCPIPMQVPDRSGPCTDENGQPSSFPPPTLRAVEAVPTVSQEGAQGEAVAHGLLLVTHDDDGLHVFACRCSPGEERDADAFNAHLAATPVAGDAVREARACARAWEEGWKAAGKSHYSAPGATGDPHGQNPYRHTGATP